MAPAECPPGGEWEYEPEYEPPPGPWWSQPGAIIAIAAGAAVLILGVISLIVFTGGDGGGQSDDSVPSPISFETSSTLPTPDGAGRQLAHHRTTDTTDGFAAPAADVPGVGDHAAAAPDRSAHDTGGDVHDVHHVDELDNQPVQLHHDEHHRCGRSRRRRPR